MIEARDLDAAVAAGVIDSDTRARLESFARDFRRGEVGPDEEQFRLLTGFNDIFVTIASGMLLVAVAILAGRMSPTLGAGGVALVSWALAEYFTRTKRMALPSIALLLSFVGGVFLAALTATTGVMSLEFGGLNGVPPGAAIAALITIVATWAHWRRFRVPITVAAGAGGLTVLMVTLSQLVGQGGADSALLTLALCGIGVFGLAMAFDSRDRARVTRNTDIAFWLHLLAAPLIIHPVFKLTGLLAPGAAPSASAAIVVITVYLALTLLALAIDRRALLVSGLAYVIYAIQALLSAGGTIEGDSRAGVTALVLGLFLVLLSAAWRPIRARVLALLPGEVTRRLPVAVA